MLLLIKLISSRQPSPKLSKKSITDWGNIEQFVNEFKLNIDNQGTNIMEPPEDLPEFSLLGRQKALQALVSDNQIDTALNQTMLRCRELILAIETGWANVQGLSFRPTRKLNKPRNRRTPRP